MLAGVSTPFSCSSLYGFCRNSWEFFGIENIANPSDFILIGGIKPHARFLRRCKKVTHNLVSWEADGLMWMP